MMDEILINILSEVGLGAAILIVMWRLGVRFIDQQMKQDEAQAKADEQRDSWMLKQLELYGELNKTLQSTSEALTLLTTELIEYRSSQRQLQDQQTNRIAAIEDTMSDFAEKVSGAMNALEASTKRMADHWKDTATAIEKLSDVHQTELSELRAEVTRRMAQMERDNHTSEQQMEKLIQQLSALVEILKETIGDLREASQYMQAATPDKPTEENPEEKT